MSINKEKVKKYFSSKKFILSASLMLVAVIMGVATSMSVNRTLKESLSGIEKELSVTKKVTENAANDVTGVTVKVPEITTGEEVSVVKNENFVFPANEKIIKDYSDFVAVKSKTMNDWRVHNAIDFEAKEGQEIKAVQSGAVLAIFNDPLWGTVVEIDHGAGVVARYCGLSDKLKVTASDVVQKGDIIGYISQIPIEAADGIHLHFEVKKDGKVVDPMEILK